MAGIGFQLRRLFDREGLLGRIHAISFASLVTVGPMLSCMLAVVAVHWMLVAEGAPYFSRELFQAGTAYAFAFSFIVSGPFSMLYTRLVSDLLYEKKYDTLLTTFYSSLRWTLSCALLPAVVFVLWAPLDLADKIPLVVLYMEMVVIWMAVVYISAMKAYKQVAFAFFSGMALAVLAIWLYVRVNDQNVTASWIVGGLAFGFFVTTALLLWGIERFFRTPEPDSSFSFSREFRRYPSLFAIGFFISFSMFEHQFAQWILNGEWLADTFRLAPQYDVAVYYAVLSVFPTLIWFVVSVETAFYPKFRQYYDSILGQGTIHEIDRSRREMEKTLIGEMARLMGIQLVFSLVAVALGIQLLPYVGFTTKMIDIYNILVMSFYVYIMVSVLLLLLLYFDDRKWALILSAVFFAANVIASWFLRDVQYQGLSLFAASFPTLLATLARLIYRLRNLHYATFSAQPLFIKEKSSPKSLPGSDR